MRNKWGADAMRLLRCGVVAAGLLAAGGASAQQCVRPAEHAAFEAAALKTQLMITALTCDVRERYNAFVSRFRGELAAHERALQGYFNRSFGGRGQQRHDDYITSLANTQSQAGLRDGTLFCQRNAGLFDEVLGLPNGASLARFAAAHPLVQAMDVAPCEEPATRTAQARGGR
jgi:hypothetical protein